MLTWAMFITKSCDRSMVILFVIEKTQLSFLKCKQL